MSNTTPALWLGGSAAYGGGDGSDNTIQDDYAQLISSAQVFSQSGATVFRMWSSLIDEGSERLVQAGVLTEAQRQQNFTFLQDIASYCKQHNIVISVEDDFDLTPLWTSDWIDTARAAGLPIAFVDDGEELLNVPDTSTALTTLAQTMVTDVKIIAAAFPNVQIGDVEPPVASSQASWNQQLQNWWTIYDKDAAADGAPKFSYFLADVLWTSPSTSWLSELEQISHTAVAQGMNFGVFLNGYGDDITSAEWIAQAKQHLAQLAADSRVALGFMVMETWDRGSPDSVTPINSPNSMANLTVSASRLFPVYQAGGISAANELSLGGIPQALLAQGVEATLRGLTVQFAPSDASSRATAAVLLIDETGILNGTVSGHGQVIGNGTNSLLLVGNSQDLNAELAAVRVSESSPGPDTLEIEAYNAQGQVAETQVHLLTLPSISLGNGLSYSFVNDGGTQTWQSSSAVTGSNGKIVSETFTWFSSPSNQTSVYEPVTTASIYSPLSHYGLVVDNGILLNPAAQGNVLYDPTTDDWYAEFQTETLLNTKVTFNPSSGNIWSETSIIAASNTTFESSIGPAASPFAGGGLIVTQFNDGSNPAWSPSWSLQLSSVTDVTTGNGSLVEQILNWKAGQQYQQSILVYSPQSHKLWQEINAAASGSTFITGNKTITEYNTGDNPNWDYNDWGNDIEVSTIYGAGFAIEQNTIKADNSSVKEFWYDSSNLADCSSEFFDSKGKLTQVWQQPASGGYILTRYDTVGNQQWSYYVQTVSASNKLVSLKYVWKAGQPYISTIQLFDQSNGKLQKVTQALRTGGTSVTLYDTVGTQSWYDQVENLNAAGRLVADHYDWRPGQPYTSSDLAYDPSSGKLQQEIDVFANGFRRVVKYTYNGNLIWSEQIQTFNATGQLMLSQYVRNIPGYALTNPGVVTGGTAEVTNANSYELVSYTGVGPGAVPLNVLLGTPAGDELITTPVRGAGDFLIFTGVGNDTIIAGSGNDTISAGTGKNLIEVGQGTNQISSTGQDTIITGSGADTITASGNRVLVCPGSGKVDFINGVGNATVVAGAGSVTVSGGSGAGVFYGGLLGQNVLTTGTGACTLYGSGGNNVLIAVGSGYDVLQAGAGINTLQGGGSSGNDVFRGGPGNDFFQAGSGNDTIYGQSGRSTVWAGSGNDLVFDGQAGSLNVAGRGNATFTAGAGSDVFEFINGSAGGIDVIDNFCQGSDFVRLQGFGSDAPPAVLATANTIRNSTWVTLADGTHVCFAGVSHLQSGSFA